MLSGWYDRGSTSGSDGIVALAGIKGAIGSGARDLLIYLDLTEKFGWPKSFVVNSAALISSVRSAIPKWILRPQVREQIGENWILRLLDVIYFNKLVA